MKNQPLRADTNEVTFSADGRPRGSVNPFEAIYLKSRWFVGAGMIGLTVLVMTTEIATSQIWAIALAGAVILAHNFAMKMWDMRGSTVALLVDLTAVMTAALIIGDANQDHIPALLTMVGGSVLIALFCEGWTRIATLVYTGGFTLVSLTAVHDGDVIAAMESFLGSAFLSLLILGVITAIRHRLVEVEAARGQTLGVVSHELRNHLTGVVGAIELITDEETVLEPDEVDELLHLSLGQAVEAEAVIEDLLVASRAERGVLDVIPEVVDLCPTTETVIRRTSLDAGEILYESDGPVWAMVDPLRYKQIMRNLLTNALRYGGDTIRVSVQRREDRVWVLVSDSGDGVDPADETALFQPYRGGRTTKGVPGSTGLGLWIARSLAHKMDGNLRYRREGGQTVFELTIPAADDPGLDAGSGPGPAREPAVAPTG